MWFLFGFITLVSFSVYAGYRRINASWKGTSKTAGNIAFQYKILKNKHGVTGFLVGIEGAHGYDFSLKKETFIDRFFKTIGLSVEHQIGDKGFDDLIYIVSDDLQLHRKLSSSDSIIAAATALFRLGEKYHCRVKEIRKNSGRLWVKLKTNTRFDEDQILAPASEAAELLGSIADAFKGVQRPDAVRWKDPFVIRAAIILAISSGLAINGATHLLRLSWVHIPFTVDSGNLLTDSISSGLVILAILITATLFFLGRSARAHLVMIEVLLVGSFGAWSTSFSELRDINIELDESSAIEYEVETLGKRVSRSRRSSSYYLYVKDWNDTGGRVDIRVSRNFFRSVSVGDSLLIKQRSGYLGYRWAESVSRQPSRTRKGSGITTLPGRY